MKRILITAKNSYIGNAFITWTADKYKIELITCRTDEWRKMDFSKYDVILHVAGIAHVSTDPNMESQYYKVNRDLTIELATKAKNEGVKQFIFLSSIIVYGESSEIGKVRVITLNTNPTPSNFYGKSKLMADQGIHKLESEDFHVVSIRPPLIYGKGSKGNYPKLSNLVKKIPLFPDIDNERSMLHIDNLCEFIRLIIKNNDSGYFYPQNKDYVKTTELVKQIAVVHGKRIKTTKVFNGIIKLLSNNIRMINKVYGSIVYEQSMSKYKEEYIVNNFEDSIRKTEV